MDAVHVDLLLMTASTFLIRTPKAPKHTVCVSQIGVKPLDVSCCLAIRACKTAYGLGPEVRSYMAPMFALVAGRTTGLRANTQPLIIICLCCGHHSLLSNFPRRFSVYFSAFAGRAASAGHTVGRQHWGGWTYPWKTQTCLKRQFF